MRNTELEETAIDVKLEQTEWLFT